MYLLQLADPEVTHYLDVLTDDVEISVQPYARKSEPSAAMTTTPVSRHDAPDARDVKAQTASSEAMCLPPSFDDFFNDDDDGESYDSEIKRYRLDHEAAHA